MCRQRFATEGSQRTPVRFIWPSLPSSSRRRNRSNPARPFDGVFSFHSGFSGSLAALENLRWHHADRGPKTCNFVLVEPCSAEPRHTESGDLLSETRSSTTSLTRWARHLLSAGMQNIRAIVPESGETAAELKAVEAPKRASAQSQWRRTDSGPIAFRRPGACMSKR